MFTNADKIQELFKHARNTKGFSEEGEKFISYIEADFVPRFSNMMALVSFLLAHEPSLLDQLIISMTKQFGEKKNG